jgi:broad specificity phosphatase PhoE
VSRRRVYLMRHAAVAYFDAGRPLHPDQVPLTAAGREQARAAAAALADVRFDRVLTSGLSRTLETAELVAPGAEVESWPELRELEAGRLADVPEHELERAFVGFFEDVVPEDVRFLGGETIGSLFDRVLPALERLLADDAWDVALAVLHGGVNRAILSYALTGGRTFLGNFEQAPACLNVLDVARGSEPGDRGGWVVRAVNVTPYDPVHLRGRLTTMEELWTEYRNTSSTTPSST